MVRVYFGTDRNYRQAARPGERFGGGRAEVSYGTCDVSIPRDHRKGALESPSIWRLEFREDPARHVMVRELRKLPAQEYFARLSRDVNAAKKKTAFVFVHGYNVSFEDAARRTAQISYDIGFEGVPAFFSWPSQASTAAYTIDEQNIEWAEDNIKVFLKDFLTKSGAEDVVLIAHSMGNRGLTRALIALAREAPELKSRMREIILTAPDIDADVFKRTLAPALIAMQRPITLYASSGDLALKASREVHGHPRAGDSGGALLVLPGIETVDASGVDTSLLGHSYFAETGPVLIDILTLVREGKRAAVRTGLKVQEGAPGRHWRFR